MVKKKRKVLPNQTQFDFGDRVGQPVGRVYLGIDPGKSGGMACITDGGIAVDYTKMPGTERDMWDWIKDKQGVTSAMVEKVHAMPGQGVTSMFTFGVEYGATRMALVAASIPFNEVRPRTWQKELGIPPRKTKTESKPQFKDRLRAKAQLLFPRIDLWQATLGEQRAVCDALLIAEYARRQTYLCGEQPKERVGEKADE